MNLNLKFGVLSALLLLMTCTRLRGSGSSIFGKVAFTAVLSVSNLNEAQAVPPFFHRMGPLAGGRIEEESDEEENESQARVEPQITSLNRDECVAKLLCGMSVPVTGTGAPKEGYYSEYANIVARFFEAFPLDDDEKGLDSSPESIEAYDDYSLEDTKPTRINSKKRKPDGKVPSKSSTGLQLIDLALIKTSDSANKTQTEEDDDERTGRERFINKRESRARKIVAKLGEKLQTVRQCQQISGCPFTFKQLRSRLKSRPSITSNVPLGDASSSPSINYNYKQPGVAGANRPSSSYQQQRPSNSPTHPHNGDDEIEQFYGSPPIVIKRPPGFGINQVSASKNQQQAEYAPYDPHTKSTPTLQPMFPKKKVSYEVSKFTRKPGSGENDEFDDVNKSTGPVTLVGGDETQQGPSKNNEANKNEGQDGQKGNDDNNEDSDEYYDEGEGDGDNEDYYNDGDDSEEGDNGEDDESGEGDEEEDTSGEGESETKKKNQNGQNSQNKKKKKQPEGSSEENDTQPGGGKTKPKVVNYKKPSSVSTSLVIEEEFEKKKPGYDDELEHPDNVWSKYSFATSGGLLKEPKDRVKTPLEEKNDEKLNVSSSSEKSSEKKKESAEDSSEEEDEDDQEDERSTRNRPAKEHLKVSIDDDEEFEATKDFMKKYKPKRRANPKYGGDHGESGKRKKASEAKEKSIKDKREKEVEKDESDSEEEEVGNKRGQIETIITHIGGRPIVPPPEAKNKQKKVGGLGRFKFNLVRPYGGGGDESEDEDTQLTPSLTSYSRKRTVLAPTEYKPSLPSYVRPTTPSKKKKPSSSASSKDYLPSYSKKTESKASSSPSHGSSSLHQAHDSASQSEGYMPKVSFGSSNGGKLGTVEYLGVQSAQAQAKQPSSIIAFPFSSTLTSLKSLFQRPGSSGANQDIPGGQNSAPAASFVHRPVGPESSKFRRIIANSKKGKGGKKGKKAGSKKYKNKRRH